MKTEPTNECWVTFPAGLSSPFPVPQISKGDCLVHLQRCCTYTVYVQKRYKGRRHSPPGVAIQFIIHARRLVVAGMSIHCSCCFHSICRHPPSIDGAPDIRLAPAAKRETPPHGTALRTPGAEQSPPRSPVRPWARQASHWASFPKALCCSTVLVYLDRACVARSSLHHSITLALPGHA